MILPIALAKFAIGGSNVVPNPAEFQHLSHSVKPRKIIRNVLRSYCFNVYRKLMFHAIYFATVRLYKKKNLSSNSNSYLALTFSDNTDQLQ